MSDWCAHCLRRVGLDRSACRAIHLPATLRMSLIASSWSASVCSRSIWADLRYPWEAVV